MFDRPRNIAKAIHDAAKKMRQKNPDSKLFTSKGPDEDFPGLVKVQRSDWPEGVTISIPTGGRYPGMIADGADLVVGYEKGRRGMPFLRGLVGGARGSVVSTVPPVYFDYDLWLQSNANAGQNALGGIIVADLYRMDPDTTSAWDLPTSDNPAIIHAGVLAYGLARFSAAQESGPSPADCYASAWQYQVEADFTSCGWKIGTWAVSDLLPLWSVDFGTITGDGLINPDAFRPFRFFADPLNGWIHALPDSSLAIPARILSAKSASLYYTSNISRGAGGLNLANASFHSYFNTVEDVEVVESYFCLPATPATSGSGQASVDFLKMNQATGEWVSDSSYDSAYIPEGGPGEIPDCLEFGSANGGLPPWRLKEVVLFSSGGVRDLFDSDRWTKSHFTARTVKTNSTNGTLLHTKTVEAVDNPPVLSYASLKAQVLAADHPLSYDGSRWLGGVELGEDTSSDFQFFHKVAPILLPVSGPNLNRVDTLLAAAAINGSGDVNWPAEIKNCGGGVVVDEAGTTWFTLIEPEQFLYGGDYTEFDTGGTQDTYLWYYGNGCESPTISGYVPTNIHPVGGAPYNPAPGDPLPAEIFTPGGCLDGADRYQHWYFDAASPQPNPLWKYRFTQKVGWRWRTTLYGVPVSGPIIEADISQKLDVQHSMFGPTAYLAATEIDFLIGNNVQPVISFADKKLVAVLRDLYLDGAGNNSSPCIEIWRVGPGSPLKLSTTRLGSFDELKPSDDFVNDAWKAGDQEWNPYAFGSPRMKACRGVDGMPVILAIVGEEKKVDTETESQFKRVCYALIELEDPESPTVTRTARTSPDEGVGVSGNLDGNYPLWSDWDTLILTPDHVAWIRDSQFQETTAP